MLAARDARLGVSSEDKRARRADIPAPAIDPGADAWQTGRVVQIQDGTGAHAHGAESDGMESSNRKQNATSTGTPSK